MHWIFLSKLFTFICGTANKSFILSVSWFNVNFHCAQHTQCSSFDNTGCCHSGLLWHKYLTFHPVCLSVYISIGSAPLWTTSAQFPVLCMGNLVHWVFGSKFVNVNNVQPGCLSLSPADLRTHKHQSCVVILLKQWWLEQ